MGSAENVAPHRSAGHHRSAPKAASRVDPSLSRVHSHLTNEMQEMCTHSSPKFSTLAESLKVSFQNKFLSLTWKDEAIHVTSIINHAPPNLLCLTIAASTYIAFLECLYHVNECEAQSQMKATIVADVYIRRSFTISSQTAFHSKKNPPCRHMKSAPWRIPYAHP